MKYGPNYFNKLKKSSLRSYGEAKKRNKNIDFWNDEDHKKFKEIETYADLFKSLRSRRDLNINAPIASNMLRIEYVNILTSGRKPRGKDIQLLNECKEWYEQNLHLFL